jgi:hypothetical protein
MADKRTPAAKKANYTGARPKDESTLSTEPRQVRNRLRRAAKSERLPHQDAQIKRDIEILYRKPVHDWDLEELARGRPRNSAGTFGGKTPVWITVAVQQEARKRLLDETFGRMSGQIDLAIKTVVKLMTSTEVDDKGKPIVDARTQLAAAMFVLEHFIGKPKAFIEVSNNDDGVRSALVPAIILDDGRPQGHLAVAPPKTVEGEIVEDAELIGDDDE